MEAREGKRSSSGAVLLSASALRHRNVSNLALDIFEEHEGHAHPAIPRRIRHLPQLRWEVPLHLRDSVHLPGAFAGLMTRKWVTRVAYIQLIPGRADRQQYFLTTCTSLTTPSWLSSLA